LREQNPPTVNRVSNPFKVLNGILIRDAYAWLRSDGWRFLALEPKVNIRHCFGSFGDERRTDRKPSQSHLAG
jgi:hypothetical protein